jgi:hypothetical protein
MAYGAEPNESCDPPPDHAIPWSAFLIASPTVRTRVEAQFWDQARELGRQNLGALLEEVDAEPAQVTA